MRPWIASDSALTQRGNALHSPLTPLARLTRLVSSSLSPLASRLAYVLRGQLASKHILLQLAVFLHASLASYSDPSGSQHLSSYVYLLATTGLPQMHAS